MRRITDIEEAVDSEGEKDGEEINPVYDSSLVTSCFLVSCVLASSVEPISLIGEVGVVSSIFTYPMHMVMFNLVFTNQF